MVIKNINLETVCGITSKLPENEKPEIAFAPILHKLITFVEYTSYTLISQDLLKYSYRCRRKFAWQKPPPY